MSARAARLLNAAGLLGLSAILLVAFDYQFLKGELPCPLCLLQRAAFAAAGVGLGLNVCVGSRPAHYAVTILSAIAGALIAGRQVLLHIVPGGEAYGSALFGLHFYTWALIAFMLTVCAAAFMLLFEGQFIVVPEQHGRLPLRAEDDSTVRRTQQEDRMARHIGTAAVLLFLALVLANAALTFAECGVGLCPDNPTSYQLFSGAGGKQ
jgi:disulfide bond formation protein DsbB